MVFSFKSNIENYYILFILKIIFSFLNLIYFIIINIFLCNEKNKTYQLVISLIIILCGIISLAISSYSVFININYIHNILNFIYGKEKIIIIEPALFLIFDLIFILFCIYITIFNFCFKIKQEVEIIQGSIEPNRSSNQLIVDMSRNIPRLNSGNTRNTIINTSQIQRNSSTSSQKQQKPNKNSNIKESKNNICIVCLEWPTELIFAPCGHKVCCKECYRKISNICPYCKRYIESTIEKVYEL